MKNSESINKKRLISAVEDSGSNGFTTNEENSHENPNILNVHSGTNNTRNEPHSNEDTIMNKDDSSSKRHRKSKKEKNGRNFVCNACNKSYLSYEALYTHKRNKHNIIPITGKPNIFRNGNSNSIGKFKYNLMDASIDVKGITDKIIRMYSEISQSFYDNPQSVLYNPLYDAKNDQFIKLLRMYNQSKIEKVRIPKNSEKNKSTIDNVLVIYLILLTEVTRDIAFSELIIKFVFLCREFLNLTGWDYLKYLQEYCLIDHFNKAGEFCSFSNCEEIPEMINDFILIFLEMEEGLSKDKTQLTDITQNFCYWLFINELTNYKLSRLDSVN